LTFHSQWAQDAYVDDFLGGLTGGFFVDVGAHDGLSLSNTLFFEAERGWTGICIEPLPDAFAKLRANRSCECLQVAVSRTAGRRTFVQVTGYAEMLSGLADEYDPRHEARIAQELKEYGGTHILTTVDSVRLEDVLAERSIGHVDYCSIDCEGGELSVLDSIDFGAVTFSALTIENAFGDDTVNDRMRAHGYTRIARLELDDVYAPDREMRRRPRRRGYFLTSLDGLLTRRRRAI
jgi:FkbM family methyltransferase